MDIIFIAVDILCETQTNIVSDLSVNLVYAYITVLFCIPEILTITFLFLPNSLLLAHIFPHLSSAVIV